MRNIKFVLLLLLSVTNLKCKSPAEFDIYYQTFTVDYTTIENDTVYYDLDNDSIFDIAATRQLDTLNNSISYSGKIFSIHHPMTFTYLRIYPSTSMLTADDWIENTTNYQWTDTVKYGGCCGSTTANGWPSGVFTPNFGFQVHADDVHYGWFHFKAFELEEIAYNRTADMPIKMGQTE